MDRRRFFIHGAAGLIGSHLISPRYLLSQEGTPLSFAVHEAMMTPTWLKRFDGIPVSDLLRRRRFRYLITGSFAGLSAPFWFNQNMHYSLQAFMSNPHHVMVTNNRYVSASGCMSHNGASRAMFWIDTHLDRSEMSRPLAFAAFVNVGSGGRTLWFVDNRDCQEQQSKIPKQFKLALARWICSRSAHPWEGGLLEKVMRVNYSGIAKVAEPSAIGVPLRRLQHA